MAGGFDHFDVNVNTVNSYYISFGYSLKQKQLKQLIGFTLDKSNKEKGKYSKKL